MPSIEEGRQRLQAGLQAGSLAPAPALAGGLPVPLPVEFPSAPNPALRTPMPKTTVLEPDTVRQFFNPATPQTRVPPLPPTTNPVSGAQAASQSITVVQSGQGTLLQTNGVNNAKQSVLNLIAGSGISLVADAQGGVTLAAGGGDGLIHGDAVQELDPAYFWLRDDFVGTSATSGEVGELQWIFLNTAGTPSLYSTDSFLPTLGYFLVPNGATANGTMRATLQVNGSAAEPDTAWPLLDFPNWKVVWVFRLASDLAAAAAFSMLKKSFYIGLRGPNQSTVLARPSDYIGLRFDTDPTAPALGDTTFKFEVVQNAPSGTRNNTAGTVVDTGITPADGDVYRFEMLCTAVGVVQLTLIAQGTSVSTTFTVPKFSQTSTITPSIVNGNYVKFSGAGGLPVVLGPWGSGSKLTVSGANGTGINGTFQLSRVQMSATPSTDLWYRSPGATAGAGASTTFNGFMGLKPFWIWGNDTTAAPADNTVLGLDYFSIVWNPGVGGGSGSPAATKPRYF